MSLPILMHQRMTVVPTLAAVARAPRPAVTTVSRPPIASSAAISIAICFRNQPSSSRIWRSWRRKSEIHCCMASALSRMRSRPSARLVRHESIRPCCGSVSAATLGMLFDTRDFAVWMLSPKVPHASDAACSLSSSPVGITTPIWASPHSMSSWNSPSGPGQPAPRASGTVALSWSMVGSASSGDAVAGSRPAPGFWAAS